MTPKGGGVKNSTMWMTPNSNTEKFMLFYFHSSTDPKEIEEYDYEYYDDTKQVSPFVNPHDPTHQSPELLAGNLAGHLAGAILKMEAIRPPTTPRPGLPTTSPPLRIFPRGQVQLERFPEGFNFNFKSD